MSELPKTRGWEAHGDQAIVAKIAEGSLDGYRDLAQKLNKAEAALAEWERQWSELRSQVGMYAKSGIDLYQRENGKAFLEMMDRWAERSKP